MQPPAKILLTTSGSTISRRLRKNPTACCMFYHLLTVVCGLVPLVESQLCGVDEFYDPVVDNCALCKDVCDRKLTPQSINFCRSVCPDYYTKTYQQQEQQEPMPNAVVDGPAPTQQENFASLPSSPQAQMTSSKLAWTDNPLYWVIIGSSVVAAILFIAIVTLLICIRRQRLINELEEGSSPGTGKGTDGYPPAGYTTVSSCSSTPLSRSTPLESSLQNTPASCIVVDDCNDVTEPMITKAQQEELVSSRIGPEG